MNRILNNRHLAWIILIVLALTWGSSFILMKKAMFNADLSRRMSSEQVAALRLVIASAVFLPFILHRVRATLRKHWLWLLLVGLLGNGIPAFLFTSAQTVLDSGVTGILNALTPLFTLLIAVAVFRQRYLPVNYAGILLALAGAVMLISGHIEGVAGAPVWAYVLVVVATVFYAMSVNIIRNKLAEVDAVPLAGIALLFVGPLALVYLAATGFFTALIHEPQVRAGVPFVAVLAVFGTSVSLILFNHLIKISNALFASSVTYMMPLVAILWGVVDGERIALTDILFSAVIIGGVYLVNWKKRVQNVA
ncbi:MAG: DMT family transporter [Cryomorphaceae bacterium]|nr:MAG: DMT family transporter [Cryomorphaceae bacterium]